MRVFLLVPFKDKDTVKALGARWDPARKSWCVEDAESLEAFLPWIPDTMTTPHRAFGAEVKKMRPIGPCEPCFSATEIAARFRAEYDTELHPANVGSIAKRLNLDYIEVEADAPRAAWSKPQRKYGENDLLRIFQGLNELADRRAKYPVRAAEDEL